VWRETFEVGNLSKARFLKKKGKVLMFLGQVGEGGKEKIGGRGIGKKGEFRRGSPRTELGET